MLSATAASTCLLSILCVGGPAAEPASSLTLTTTANDGAVQTIQLQCDPSGGTHPNPEKACAAIEHANGKLGNLAVAQRACPMIYAPVEVSAEGSWKGTPVDFDAAYGNDCIAEAETADVFVFD